MDLESIWDKIKDKPNVVGYSKVLRKRIKEGREVDELCFRVYVTKKVPICFLGLEERIPRSIKLENKKISIDVVEIGELKYL